MHNSFYVQLMTILALSLLTALVFQRLKMATIIAYICVGVLVGPHALAVVHDPSDFSLLAEFGVVFLLFSLGLEFNLEKLKSMRFTVFGVGSIQVIICSIVFTLAVYLWGGQLSASILIAGALALSSTAVVTKELMNRRETSTHYGQLSIGILIFQDLVAIILLILVPVLSGNDTQLVLWQEVLGAVIRGIALLFVLILIGRWVLPYIYIEISRYQSEEVFVLSTLVVVLLAGWLTHQFHLSMALGGFITGMMFGEGVFRYQVQKDIRPFKDILMGLFFVYIGMALDTEIIAHHWLRLLAFTTALVLIKTILVSAALKMMRVEMSHSIKVGIILAQSGEFGIALMALALSEGIIPAEQSSFVILIAILSMAISPFLIRYSDPLLSFLTRSPEHKHINQDVSYPQQQHVIIGGAGRVGTTLINILNRHNIPYVAIDNDIQNVATLQAQNNNILYGDCSDIDILKNCHLPQASLAVLTLKSIKDAKSVVKSIRKVNQKVSIIVRCYEQGNIEELISLGANHVYPEVLESSILISSQALRLLGINEQYIDQHIKTYRENL